MLCHRIVSLAVLLLLVSAAPSVTQDSNILLPISEIERRLEYEPFEVTLMRPSRGIPGERTHNVVLEYGDGTMVQAKWAPAPKGGFEFNNQPRLEIAAYELQKLFLDESEYVVPPTLARCVSVDEYPDLDEDARRPRSTFSGSDEVLVVLQYWLWNVDQGSPAKEFIDQDRFEQDPVYARHSANFSLLGYLIRHRDSNQGNFLRSRDLENPRAFLIDNGIAFESEGESTRGNYWEKLRVKRLPRSSVERLRLLTEEDLHSALGVFAEFHEDEHGNAIAVQPTPNLSPELGIRTKGRVLQLGLTSYEIGKLYNRIQRVLDDVDKGKVEVF
jgi:hypothetical protein